MRKRLVCAVQTILYYLACAPDQPWALRGIWVSLCCGTSPTLCRHAALACVGPWEPLPWCCCAFLMTPGFVFYRTSGASCAFVSRVVGGDVCGGRVQCGVVLYHGLQYQRYTQRNVANAIHQGEVQHLHINSRRCCDQLAPHEVSHTPCHYSAACCDYPACSVVLCPCSSLHALPTSPPVGSPPSATPHPPCCPYARDGTAGALETVGSTI